MEDEDDCAANKQKSKIINDRVFTCAAGGGDGFHIDPYGQMPLCNLIRRQKVSLLTHSIEEGMNRLLPLARNRRFKTDSKCRSCKLLDLCLRCPGKALVETDDIEAPIEYFCELAHLVSNRNLVHR